MGVQRFPYLMLTSTKKHPSRKRHETTRQVDKLHDLFTAAVNYHHSPEGSVYFSPQPSCDDVPTLGRIHVSRNQGEEIGWLCLLSSW